MVSIIWSPIYFISVIISTICYIEGIIDFKLNNFNKGVTCVCCNWSGASFLPCPYGSEPHRKNSLCPQCGSLERHRLYFLFLKNVIQIDRKIKVLHFAPEQSIKDLFVSYPNIEYVSTDLNRDDVTFKEDITHLSFREDSFDIIFCSHVLEHIDDDRKAMSELYRVLKLGGFAILQVPIYEKYNEKKLEQTFEDAKITDLKMKKELFGQEDHVRLYALDYKERLTDAGFKVDVNKYSDSLDPAIVKHFALLPEGNESQTDGWIYFCTK